MAACGFQWISETDTPLGTGTLSMTPGPSGTTVEHPRFSPDGQKILFTGRHVQEC
jgi:Tol biopolymer transport system component